MVEGFREGNAKGPQEFFVRYIRTYVVKNPILKLLEQGNPFN